MNHRLAQEAFDYLTAIEGQVRAKRFAPMPPADLKGRFQHFATEQDRQAHLEYIEQHAADLPF